MRPQAASIVSGLTNLLNQPAPVILGSLVLAGPEAPSRITVGGAQLAVIHRLPGGGRIIDAMGPDNSAVTWRGIFIGPQAAERVRAIDAMRVSGQTCPFSFGDYQFDVFISQFQYSYESRGAVISYSIRAERTQDPIAPIGMTVLEQVKADFALGLQFLTNARGSLAAYSDYMQAGIVGALDTSLNAVAESGNSDPAFGTQGPSLSVSILSTATTALGQSIADCSVGIPIQPDVDSVFTSGRGLISVAQNAGVLASLVGAGGYAGRAARKLADDEGSIAAIGVHS